MKNFQKGGIGIWGTIIVLIIIGFAIYGVAMFYKSNSANNPSNNSAQSQSPQIQTATIEQKSKCAEDGKAFIDNYETTNNYAVGGLRPVWGDPQYHYNSRLNTCLAYIWYVRGKGSPSNIGDPMYTTVYDFVFDVYSNQPILQTVNDRVVPFGGERVDTVSKYPLYNNVPNLDGATFSKQFKVLMSE